jgi:small-conductance mechanosensitive channel
MGELLVARSLKVAAVLLGAVVLNRLVRWLLRRLVGGLEHRFIQNRLESLRAKTPRPLLASTDPLPSLRRSQRAEMIGAAVANVASVAIWLVAAIGVLHVLGLRLGPLLAGVGLAGLVLSLSAQQMVRDFLSGIAMLMEDQYGPGDVIDAGPAKGVAERPQPEGEPRGCGGGGWGLAFRRRRRRRLRTSWSSAPSRPRRPAGR